MTLVREPIRRLPPPSIQRLSTRVSPPVKFFLKRVFSPPLTVLGALLMFLEEWLWEHLQRLMAAIGRLPAVRALEAAIARLPPYPAMAVFLLPVLLLLPVKLVALWFIVRGQAVLGLLVIVIAKLIGTAFVTRIFVLCKPNLLALNWFQRLHDGVLAIRERLYAYVRASSLWQAARRWVQTMRSLFRGVNSQF